MSSLSVSISEKCLFAMYFTFLGTLLLLVTGSIAFMTLTFVNEAMGAANALLNREDGDK